VQFDTERYKGWMVITIKRHTAWQIHNFLPLVDSMYSKIKENYTRVGGRLLFDLSGLTYFDSTMVSLILRAVRLTGDSKNAVVITDEKTRDILTLLGIDKLVDMYESETAFTAANPPA
jgi:anti-anti-sigma regulatory factor